MRRNNMRAGFTLIELLIVLAIIAALLSIVTPVAVNAVRQANATRVASNMRNIAAAVQQYIMVEKPPYQEGVDNVIDIEQDLVQKGYLTSNPNGTQTQNPPFEAKARRDGDTITITVTYNGDLNPNDLQKVFPDIVDKKLEVKIAKWW